MLLEVRLLNNGERSLVEPVSGEFLPPLYIKKGNGIYAASGSRRDRPSARPTLGLTTCDHAKYTPTADRACGVKHEEFGRRKTEPKELQRSGKGHARERSGAPKYLRSVISGFSHKILP